MFLKLFKTLKASLLLLSIAIFSSCSSLKINEPNSRFVVNSFWAQNSLAAPNPAFRKVNRMTPVIYKKSIIVGNALDGLVSYDLDTKNEIWRLNIPFGVEASGVSIKDRLFVGSNGGTIYSVNMSNGEIVWKFDTKSELVAEPLLDNGILYFLSGSQSVYALDAGTGKQLWVYSRQDTTSNMTIRGGSKPSISNGIIYSGFSDGSLVALNSKTGTVQWEITLNRNTKFKDIDASPIIDEESIYINSYDDMIYCLSKDKGEIIWKSPYGGQSTPLIFKKNIYVTSSKGELVSLSKNDGSLIWKKTTTKGIYIDPVIYDIFLVVGETQGKLVFLNPENGTQLGAFEPGRGIFSKPVVNDKSVYFISGEGNIYGVKAQFEKRSNIYYLK